MNAITVEFVLAIHKRQIERYGGAPGVRDRGALESCLRQPYQSAFGKELYPAVVDRAAAFAFFFCMNHRFVDGNKRVATALLLTLLEAEGWELQATEDEINREITALAAGKRTREAWLRWVRDRAKPAKATGATS